MTNVLVAIARVFGGNFGISIIIFTIVMRIATWPLTSSQYKASKAMQTIQPKLQELQKKHKNDRQEMQRQTMALYREHGVNPLGCLLPMLVQMPIWIALYRVIQLSLGETPESVVVLSHQLYPIPFVHSAAPLDTNFLIWNLGAPDTLLILPILVGITMYVQQKMITPAPATPQAQMSQQQLQQQQTQQMMTWMLPLMFAYFSFNVPSGLALYWAVSNLAGIAGQYFVVGRKVDWAGMLRFGPPQPAGTSARALRPQPAKQAGTSKNNKPAPAPAEAPGADISEADEAAAAPRAAGGGSRRKRHGRRRGKR
jgi:YidC/Oxa1 family membrane protein insertase